MNEPVIQIENLHKEFGRGRNRKRAVNGINLSVAGGQVYGFLGANGAGKSTTLRMVLTLMHPTAGRALVLGRDPRQEPSVLRKVGSLVEGATFYPYLKGWDNLMVVGNSQGGFDPKRAENLLNLVGLKDAARVRFKHYSTGMKQRLGIAAALLNDPQVVILDEPTNGMDPMGIREMRKFIRDLAHVHGKTVFLTSHLLGEVQQTCDRVAIIHHGEILREAGIDELLAEKPVLDAEVSSAEKARAALQERWQVHDGENGLIKIDATREDTPTIIRLLVENQVDIFSIAPHRESLEDVFLSLVEEVTP